eukprot:IDg17090t1
MKPGETASSARQLTESFMCTASVSPAEFPVSHSSRAGFRALRTRSPAHGPSRAHGSVKRRARGRDPKSARGAGHDLTGAAGISGRERHLFLSDVLLRRWGAADAPHPFQPCCTRLFPAPWTATFMAGSYCCGDGGDQGPYSRGKCGAADESRAAIIPWNNVVGGRHEKLSNDIRWDEKWRRRVLRSLRQWRLFCTVHVQRRQCLRRKRASLRRYGAWPSYSTASRQRNARQVCAACVPRAFSVRSACDDGEKPRRGGAAARRRRSGGERILRRGDRQGRAAYSAVATAASGRVIGAIECGWKRGANVP